MSKVLWFLLLGIALLAGWVWRRGRVEEKAHPKPPPFRCVSIRPGWTACQAALVGQEKRYLPHEAPGLPRPECDIEQCTCRYIHHADRRDAPRRAADIGLANPHFSGQNRRLAYDRRRTSWQY